MSLLCEGFEANYQPQILPRSDLAILADPVEFFESVEAQHRSRSLMAPSKAADCCLVESDLRGAGLGTGVGVVLETLAASELKKLLSISSFVVLFALDGFENEIRDRSQLTILPFSLFFLTLEPSLDRKQSTEH